MISSVGHLISAVKEMTFNTTGKPRAISSNDFNTSRLREVRGLMFRFDLVASHVRNRVYKDVRILIVNNHWVFVSSDPKELWINEGNHDSEWLSAVENWLTSLYFDMCRQVAPELAPKEVTLTCGLSVFTSIQKVKVCIAPDKKRNDKHGSDYWHKIVSVKGVTEAEFRAFDAL